MVNRFSERGDAMFLPGSPVSATLVVGTGLFTVMDIGREGRREHFTVLE